MDTYAVKKTPIKGVWELGRLTPDYNVITTGFHRTEPDIRVLGLANYLGISVENGSYFNPSGNPGQVPMSKKLDWHVDNFVYGGKLKTKPSEGSEDCILMIAGTCATRFRKFDGSIWRARPWTIYFVRYYVVHATPRTKTPRCMSRLYVQEKRASLKFKVS
jgi:hypothetical protein